MTRHPEVGKGKGKGTSAEDAGAKGNSEKAWFFIVPRVTCRDILAGEKENWKVCL